MVGWNAEGLRQSLSPRAQERVKTCEFYFKDCRNRRNRLVLSHTPMVIPGNHLYRNTTPPRSRKLIGEDLLRMESTNQHAQLKGCNSRTIKRLGAGVAKWWERSSFTNESRVRFPNSALYVDWVCWFSTLLREVFLRVLRFSPLLKNQHSI